MVSHSTCFPSAAVYMVIRSITPSETERERERAEDRRGGRVREISMSVSQRSERGARKARHCVVNASHGGGGCPSTPVILLVVRLSHALIALWLLNTKTKGTCECSCDLNAHQRTRRYREMRAAHPTLQQGSLEGSQRCYGII